MAGPLQGLRIIEMAGIGPGPFCAMMLADQGAEVIRVEQKRSGPAGSDAVDPGRRYDVLARGRRSLAIDLKKPGGGDAVLSLVEKADGLIEGFRPGVMERLGLGPEVCHARNPRLVFGRMTGWGQTGPLAHAAGHDINYLSLTGALNAIGFRDSLPCPPLNLVADFGGGAMMLAFGMVCALLEASRSGKGQVIDAAMTDGAALLSAAAYGYRAAGRWSLKRQDNLLDGGAHYYTTYACADGKFISIGPLEPQFYREFLQRCGLNEAEFMPQTDPSRWPELRVKFETLFKTRTRAQWCELLEGTDVCFAPILDWDEAPQHAHNKARQTFVEIDGVTQPAPAPRFSRTPGKVRSAPAARGEHTQAILEEWGLSAQAIAELQHSLAI